MHLPDSEGTLTEDVEIGWHLHPDHWGNGYATEAATRLLRHADETLGITEINALAYPGNDASIAVMRRLGMQPSRRDRPLVRRPPAVVVDTRETLNT